MMMILLLLLLLLLLYINPLNSELNPICHLLALLGGATIVVVSRLRVNFPCSIRNVAIVMSNVHTYGCAINIIVKK